eukprot:GFKZ01009004.1.p1 GENE.GFKZ01009004.1~~GFKZ01009004.1.p1  ORF type:complete len:672 (+),score=89.79 GFKZ01009004.1:213-2018(+)
MWYLIEEPDTVPATKQRPCYWLGGLTGNGRTIGRKHVDIRLKASSVSRTHARVTIQKSPFYSPSLLSGRQTHHATSVFVQDSSAYGTFLKYPAGHPSNRAESAVGHHRRLDKDAPVEVCEGALLAFGAPSGWWRLGWHHIVISCSRIPLDTKERIEEIVALTGIETCDTWGEGCTHLVMNECDVTSFKWLRALVECKPIVTSAWLEAVRHTVAETCRGITEAPNEEAAMAICRLPDVAAYIPPFCKADIDFYGDEPLGQVWAEAIVEKRKKLFDGCVFVFGREERRARWALIVELLGGVAVFGKKRVNSGKVFYMQGEYGSGRRAYEDVPGRAYVPENVLTEVIVRADLEPMHKAVLVKSGGAEVTDVATPGPLDNDSEGESDDDSEIAAVGMSTGAERRNREGMATVGVRSDSEKRTGKQGSGADFVGEKGVQDSSQGTWAKKRARVTGEREAGEQSKLEAKETRPIAAIDGEGLGEYDEVVGGHSACNEEVVDNSDVNQRVFFEVGRGVDDKGAHVEGGNDDNKATWDNAAADGAMNVVRNVRRFRRRKIPQLSVIPLKRAQVMSNSESAFGEGPAEPESLRRGEYGEPAAQVMASDEE